MCGLWGGMGGWGPLVSLRKKRGQSEGLRVSKLHTSQNVPVLDTAPILEEKAIL